MEQIISQIQELAQSEYLTVGYLKYIAMVCGALLVLSLIGRFVTGGKSIFRGSVGAAAGILFMYIVIIAVDASHVEIPFSLPALPFAAVWDARLYIMPITQVDFYTVCLEFLHLLTLAFFVAIFDAVIPKTKNILLWVLRCLLLMVLSFIAQGIISYCFVTYFPETLVQWTPVILLGFLMLVMLLGLIKLILGVALAAINPAIAAVYAFFFMHRFGKMISTAVLTTIMLGVLIFISDYFGYTVIALAASGLVVCLPFLAAFLLFWFLVS